MRIAVLCPSNIAFRRFMPALMQIRQVEYAGIGVASPDEWTATRDQPSYEDAGQTQREFAGEFRKAYGGLIYPSFAELLADESVDAVYVPLPPALHHTWAMSALKAGKHVLVEKPFATTAADARQMVSLAEERGLAVHENYMFAYHSQIEWIRSCVEHGDIGNVRLVRIDFGFPFRGENDFRYSSELGGGALLDAGGYTLKLAHMLLGSSCKVDAAMLNEGRGLEVDLYGCATLSNDDGCVAQVAFGMDNDYRCSIDVWGSEATLMSDRILTAPAGFCPTVIIRRNGKEEALRLSPDDTFRKSIEHFLACIDDPVCAANTRSAIVHQSELVESVRLLSQPRLCD